MTLHLRPFIFYDIPVNLIQILNIFLELIGRVGRRRDELLQNGDEIIHTKYAEWNLAVGYIKVQVLT